MDIIGIAIMFFMIGFVIGGFTPDSPRLMGVIGLILTLFIVMAVFSPNTLVQILGPSNASLISDFSMALRQGGAILFAAYLGGLSSSLLFISGSFKRHR